MGEYAAHDHRWHDATRRCDEGQAQEAVGAPAAEERMAGEEIDGVDLPEHEAGGVAEALAQVERCCDHLILGTQRKQPADVDRQERPAAETRQLSAPIGDMGMHAPALPETELGGIGIDHQVGTPAGVPIVVAIAIEHPLVEAGRPEVETQTVLAERVASTAPVTTEGVPGPKRFGGVRRCLSPGRGWRGQGHGQGKRQGRTEPRHWVLGSVARAWRSRQTPAADTDFCQTDPCHGRCPGVCE